MTDEEILTTRLSDWKPETDIIIVKAMGKLVEETGELLDVISAYDNFEYEDNANIRSKIEEESADCIAFATILEMVTGITDNLDLEGLIKHSFEEADSIHNDSYLFPVAGKLGKLLNIVGRCQIQGIGGSDPNTHKPNLITLKEALLAFKESIHYTTHVLRLDSIRIEKRKLAKIESKFPWIMGTATDLLPST